MPIQSGMLAIDIKVVRHMAELTVCVSSCVRAKPSTLTPHGLAAINTNTPRAMPPTFSNRQNSKTIAGITTSFAAVMIMTAEFGRGLKPALWRTSCSRLAE